MRTGTNTGYAWAMNRRSGHMTLAGVRVADELVIELAEILVFAGFVHTAGRILHAHADAREVELATGDREAILRALEDAPDAPAGLGELRTALLQRHVRRKKVDP